MLTLPTVLLLHETRAGTHHDWLLGDPTRAGAPDAPLWTARVATPTWHWRAARRLHLTPLPPHRRAYLAYQGPVAGGRGAVRRLDAGTVQPELWAASRIVLNVEMRWFRGRMELVKRSPALWDAVVL